MTKPLQGALFWKFRDQIMGVVPAQDPGPGKAKTKIDESNAHAVKPTKGKKLKPSRGKSTINSLVLSKVKGRHHRSVLGEASYMHEGWTFDESHTYELKRHLNTSKHQTRFCLTSIN
jgi:hypothetical protein